MEEEEILDVDINEFLKEDLALAQRDLGAVATLKGSQVKRIRKYFSSFIEQKVQIWLFPRIFLT